MNRLQTPLMLKAAAAGPGVHHAEPSDADCPGTHPATEREIESAVLVT